MALLSHLIDPEILARMSDRELAMVNAALDAELHRSPEVVKELKTKIDPFVRKFAKKQP